MGRQPCCTRKGCAMELSIPASPSRLAGLRRAARVYLRGVAEVVVQVNDDWVGASVLDRGPAPPAGFPAAADTDELRVGGRGLWLLCRLVDEVRLERVRLGTRVTLRRAIGPAGTLAR